VRCGLAASSVSIGLPPISSRGRTACRPMLGRVVLGGLTLGRRCAASIQDLMAAICSAWSGSPSGGMTSSESVLVRRSSRVPSRIPAAFITVNRVELQFGLLLQRTLARKTAFNEHGLDLLKLVAENRILIPSVLRHATLCSIRQPSRLGDFRRCLVVWSLPEYSDRRICDYTPTEVG